MSFYPQTEANSEELVGTHLGPRPVTKLLSIVNRQHGLVLPVVEGLAGSLQEGFLLHTQAGGQHRQQGRHKQQEGHSFLTAELPQVKLAGGRQPLASYSLQSLEMQLGWIIDRVAHSGGNNQLLRGPFFLQPLLPLTFMKRCNFNAVGLEEVLGAHFLEQDQRAVIC